MDTGAESRLIGERRLQSAVGVDAISGLAYYWSVISARIDR